MKNSYEDSIMSMNTYLRRYPFDSSAHYINGRSFQKLNKNGDAIKSYLKSLKIDPKNQDSMLQLAALYFKQGNTM